MENPWRAPVVAVEDGTVKYWESGLGGCMLYHYGRSGTTYLYIHLNNDLTPRNDNKGGCVKRRHVCRSQRREGDGGPADRLERRLGRRQRQPASPLRGASERRWRREPVQAPEAGEQTAVHGTEGNRLQPRRSAEISSPQGRAPRRSRSLAFANTRVGAGSTSTPAKSSSPSHSEPTSRGRSFSSRVRRSAP